MKPKPKKKKATFSRFSWQSPPIWNSCKSLVCFKCQFICYNKCLVWLIRTILLLRGALGYTNVILFFWYVFLGWSGLCKDIRYLLLDSVYDDNRIVSLLPFCKLVASDRKAILFRLFFCTYIHHSLECTSTYYWGVQILCIEHKTIWNQMTGIREIS